MDRVWIVTAPCHKASGFSDVERVFGSAELAERYASMGDMEVTETQVITSWEDA